MKSPGPEPTVALEVSADEASLIIAYRRASPWHRTVLRFLANYFVGADDDDQGPPDATIIRLFGSNGAE